MLLEAFVLTAIFGCVQLSVPSAENRAVLAADAAQRDPRPLEWGPCGAGLLRARGGLAVRPWGLGRAAGGHPSGPHGVLGRGQCWCGFPGRTQSQGWRAPPFSEYARAPTRPGSAGCGVREELSEEARSGKPEGWDELAR